MWLEETLQKVFGEHGKFYAIVGDGNGNVASSRSGFILVRVPGFGLIEVFNGTGKTYRDGQVVLIGRDEKSLYPRFCVLDVNTLDISSPPGGGPGGSHISHHGNTHHLFGGDPVYLHSLQYLPLAPVPIQNSKSVSVFSAFIVGENGRAKYFPGQTIDLTSYYPPSGARFALLEYDYATNSIAVTAGPAKPTRNDLTFTDAPAISTERVPVALVVLDASLGKIVVSENLELLYDLRFFKINPEPDLSAFMMKNVYDQNDNGIVDDAEKLSGVTPTAQGLALLGAASAEDQRAVLGLGTMATEDADDYMRKDIYDQNNNGVVDDSERLAGVVPTAQGLALLDDATAEDQRATLGLGTMATENASDYMKISVYDQNANGIVDQSESTKALQGKPINPTISPSPGDILFWDGTKFTTGPSTNVLTAGELKDYFISGGTASGSIGALGWILSGGSVSQGAKNGIILNSPASAGYSYLALGANVARRLRMKYVKFVFRFNTSFSSGGNFGVGLWDNFTGTLPSNSGIVLYTTATDGSSTLQLTSSSGTVDTGIVANTSAIYVATFTVVSWDSVTVPVLVKIVTGNATFSGSVECSPSSSDFFIGARTYTSDTTVRKMILFGFHGILDYSYIDF